MKEESIMKASLAELREKKNRGELHHEGTAPEGESLGADFWAKAELRMPEGKRSVHLKLERDVFQFFYEQAHGKGHLTQMQAVLKAYVDAHRR